MGASGGVYTDFTSLSQLRADARQGSDDSKREVGEQIEGLFIGMMLKSMRSASAAVGDSGASMPRDLYDSQMALHLSKGAGLGFAEMMLSQLGPAHQPPSDPASDGHGDTPPVGELSVPGRSMTLARSLWSPTAGSGSPRSVELTHDLAALARPSAGLAPDARKWDSPAAFVRDLMPAASDAARALGTTPEAVLAVAALETGWGRHMPSRADGTPSYNLFGIKAHGWNGEVTRASTLEFESGAFHRKNEPFRSYDSPAHAIADFATFIKTQPRYAQALKVADKPESFLRALHGAGYATDPRYGDKLVSMLRSAPLAQGPADTPGQG